MTLILTTVLFMLLAGYVVWVYSLSPISGKPHKTDSNAMYILALSAAAFIVRLVLAAVYKGHDTDMSCFIGWSGAIFENGISKFYTLDMFHDYPPGYMYVLYIIGAIQHLFNFSGGMYYILIKLPAIVCDIITAIIVYKIAKKKLPDGVSALLAALYLFNPAIAINSSLWGQVDAVYTLFIVLMIYFITEKKMILSYFMFAICIFIKPQAFIFTPVLICGIVENVFLKDFSREKLIKNLLFGFGAILMMLLLALPFGIGNVFKQYTATLASYPYLTVNALNFWGAIGKNWEAVTPATNIIGYIFIAAITVYSMTLFFKSKNESKYYFAGAVLAFFTYMLSTKMHERYAFPALILFLLAFVLSMDIHSYIIYFLVSASQLFNSAWVLFVYTQDSGAHYRSMPVTVASVINIAILIYIIFAADKLHFKNKKELAVSNGNKSQAAKKTVKNYSPKKGASKVAASNGAAQKNGSFKLFKSAVFPKVTRADIIAMAVITAVYAGIALYDLGDMHAPQTEYALQNGSVTLDLGAEKDISKFKFFLSSKELGEERAITITATDGSGAQTYTDTIKNGSVFHWEEIVKDLKARYITLSTNGDNLPVKEFAVIGKDNSVITPVSASPEAGSALFDEQGEVPDRSTFRNGTYFDEIYHARTGYEFVHSLSVYEWTHPPLGKVFIAAGIKLFGMCPFGWRIAGTVFGIIMVPIIYMFALRLLKKSWLAIVTCLLFTFDFMHFAQTRIATIDVYVTFFIMLMYYFMYKYYSTSFYDSSFKKGLVSLALCGTCMGLGIASKWTGIYAGAGLAILFFITLYKRYKEYLYALKTPRGTTDGIKHEFIINNFKPYLIKTIIWCCIFFIAVPAIIYCVSYIPYLKAPDASGFKTIIDNQNAMYTYHSKTVLGSEHPYSSRWYEWIIMKRPIWYYSGTVSDGVKEGISSFGNPLIWWLGIPAFFYMIYLSWAKKDKNALFLMIAYLAQLVSWIPVTRLTFIYHYFPCVPFIVLMIGYSLYSIYNDAKNKKAAFGGIIAYTALVIVLFAMFYPVLSGHACSIDYAENFLKWFNSWVLL